ncbi:MAG: WYL domain-containing protein [FCB group bacterium]|nr:WYL domain-containing protein [FCB group bacterium]
MSDFTQIERILRIIQILSSGTRLTTAALMRRFDDQVALRTLQRDLNKIANSGIPVRSRKTTANENEWFLDSSFRTFIPQTLGLNEYLAAHMLKENLKVFRNTEFSDEVDSLLEKIEQIVPEDVFLETDESDPEDLFENYSTGLFDYTGYDEIINTIIQAIIQNKKSFVSYYNAYEQKSKNFYVEPRRIVYFKGGLYVIAYVRRFEKFRLLAIQRIRKFKIQDEVYQQDPVFDEGRFWKNKFGLFSADQQEVKLEFSPEVRMHIEGRHWHTSQIYSEGDAGSLILELKVGLSPELISWIFGWNEYVDVLSPPELIGMMSQKIQVLNKKYPTT